MKINTTLSMVFGLGLTTAVSFSTPAWSEEGDCPAPGASNLSGHDLEVADNFGGEDIGFATDRNPGDEARGGADCGLGLGGQEIELNDGQRSAAEVHEGSGCTLEFGGQDIELTDDRSSAAGARRGNGQNNGADPDCVQSVNTPTLSTTVKPISGNEAGTGRPGP